MSAPQSTGRVVRFDLKMPRRIPDTEVRLAARAFIKRQGDVPVSVEIMRVHVGLDHSGRTAEHDRPVKAVIYGIRGVVE